MSGWLVEGIGAIAALLSTICWLPQAVRTVRTRDTRSLSLVTTLMLFTAVGLWFIYGVELSSLPLIAANGISFLLIGTIVAMKLRYG